MIALSTPERTAAPRSPRTIRNLSQIHSITSDCAVVDAGVVWHDLLRATTAVGLTPPVLPDSTRLTIGGIWLVGGSRRQSYQHGTLADNVLELRVITPEGRLVTCSATERKDLFDRLLAGLGPRVLIVRTTLRLVPAKERAQTYRLFYADASSMLADLRHLVRKERFDYVRGNITASPDLSKGFTYCIEATSFYTAPDDLPTDPLAGLRPIPGLQQVEDRTYFDFTPTFSPFPVFLA